MKRFWGGINPTVRGFLVIALVAFVVVILQLQTTLVAIGMLLRIAFFLAIAFFVYLLWRERRADINGWPRRQLVVFYGSAAVAVADLAVFFWVGGLSGLSALAFFLVLAICGFAMFRVWRDQHTYGV